jgi:DNA-binding MarR family transcriptional regulator
MSKCLPVAACVQTWSMATEASVTDVVMAASRALVGIAAQSIAEVSDEVSLAQYRTLVLVEARNGMTMGDLAEMLGVNPSTATRLCDALEKKGLVERAPTPESRRVVRVEVTRDGRSLVRRSMRRRRRLIDAAVRQLPVEAQRRLGRSLAELTQALGAAGEHAWALGWPAPGLVDPP